MQDFWLATSLVASVIAAVVALVVAFRSRTVATRAIRAQAEALDSYEALEAAINAVQASLAPTPHSSRQSGSAVLDSCVSFGLASKWSTDWESFMDEVVEPHDYLLGVWRYPDRLALKPSRREHHDDFLPITFWIQHLPDRKLVTRVNHTYADRVALGHGGAPQGDHLIGPAPARL